MLNLNDAEVGEVQNALLNWFASNMRSFPWRKTNEPFSILIAEKLLQQTAARDSVVKAYETLLRKYPTPQDLAKAKIDDLIEIIKPLGLLYRAQELKKMGGEISEYHNNEVPDDLNKLLSLTGIGDYSARATLSFAYHQDVPIVDTNVARFLYRFFGLKEPIPENPARKKQLRELATLLLPRGNSRAFNLAILDLCALVCKSSHPKCLSCPLKEFCIHGKKVTS